SLSVQQSPQHLTKRPGNTLKMTCSHHDRNYDQIYWYRQTDGQKLQLIGFLSFKQALDVAENFNISGDAEDEGFLGSLAVRVDDTGLYYCSVSKAQ
uniref:Ig-like domain-containing protein n=1 Tax=Oncorhynchus tshawytscha TaxID=74940 RepID=A0A8C8C707_ONCTS